jgi:hypothetical protein
MDRVTGETVTQGQSKPPRNLARFIELVNAERLFERERKLPDPYDGFMRDVENARDAHTTDVDIPDLWIEHCERTARILSAAARRFLGRPAEYQTFLEKWALLKSAGQVLSGIASRYAPAPRPKSPDVTIQDARFPGRELPFSIDVGLVVNEAGVLIRARNDLLDALIDARADRIRSCVICNRIFWARRINSECCTERCRKTYNQRNSRDARKRLTSRTKRRSAKGR